MYLGFLLTLCLASSAARAQFTQIHEWTPEEMSRLRAAVLGDVAERAPVTGAELIREFAPRDLGPGAAVIGRAYAHEVNAATRLGGWVHERYGHHVLLIASVEDLDVPGYDGLILDADRNVIGCISLKGWSKRVRNGRLLELAHHAAELARHDGWVRSFLTGHATWYQDMIASGRARDFSTSGNPNLIRNLARLRVMMRIFVGRNPRPTVLVIDRGDQPLVLPDHLVNLIEVSEANPLVPGALVLSPGGVHVVWKGELDPADRGCEAWLT